jgi:sterol desaturase/sphingolipid hydroxylase (fatty acid hydroxylase superfamily)
VLDYAPFPLFVLGTPIAVSAALGMGAPGWLAHVFVFVPVILLAGVAERLRPERPDFVRLDQPLAVEIGHLVFNLEVGYGVALAAIAGTSVLARRASLEVVWPSALPLAAQVALALVVYEATSYWQHRLSHRVPWLWRFHLLHHSGERLNLVRLFRFQSVDLALAAFAGWLPLVLLGTPDKVMALMVGVITGFSIVQHANLRMRTPAWLDRLLCTAAVHRHHHSVRTEESDRNFGTTVMWFDHLFGTWGRPHLVGPERMGVERDPMPSGFLAQYLWPFRSHAA